MYARSARRERLGRNGFATAGDLQDMALRDSSRGRRIDDELECVEHEMVLGRSRSWS